MTNLGLWIMPLEYAIDAMLEREGAVTARMVASHRGGDRSAYESARRSLRKRVARGELVVNQYWVEDPFDENEPPFLTERIYGLTEAACRELAEVWWVVRATTAGVPTS